MRSLLVYFHEVRGLPADRRERVTLIAASVCTVIIALLWLVNFRFRLETESSMSQSVDLAPFELLRREASRLFTKIGETR